MVGNLEITAKTEKMVGTRLRLVHHTKGLHESEQLGVGCTFEDTELIYVLD